LSELPEESCPKIKKKRLPGVVSPLFPVHKPVSLYELELSLSAFPLSLPTPPPLKYGAAVRLSIQVRGNGGRMDVTQKSLAVLQTEADKLREHIRQNPAWSTLEREQLQEVEKEIEKRGKAQEIRY
jgi:hypothetical protein